MERSSKQRKRPRPAPLLVVLLFGAAALLAGSAVAAQDDLVLISRASGANGAPAAADSNNDEPSLSFTGTLAAFRSDADNLSKADNDSVSNIFVRSLTTKKTILVSRAGGAAGDAGGGLSRRPAISGNGRYVAFESSADNLTPNDSENTYDIFVRDLLANTTTLVSLRTGPPGKVTDPVTSKENSFEPAISASGRYVAFTSREKLSSADTNSFDDVYLRDVKTNTTTLVSRANGADGAVADGISGQPAISPNGRLVAFRSQGSTNLGAGLPANAPNNSQVYVRDLGAGTTALVSRASAAAGIVGDRQSQRPSLSATRIAFESQSKNLAAGSATALSNVFVRDLATLKTTLVSVPATGGGAGVAGGSRNPKLSADGAVVAFESGADDISAKDDNLFENIFVRDLAAGKTTLVSRASGAGGKPADSQSAEPSISSTGKYVTFTSDANDLSSQDRNDAASNVFRRQLR